MKKTIILLVLILINSCSSSKTSTQTNDQDKSVIANSDIENGKKLFSLSCTACHLDDGGGLIGPNLTDAYTISGCSFEEIATVIAKGTPNKGMYAWEQILNKKEILQLTSYIISLKGTTPKQPKHPEGELCSE